VFTGFTGLCTIVCSIHPSTNFIINTKKRPLFPRTHFILWMVGCKGARITSSFSFSRCTTLVTFVHLLSWDCGPSTFMTELHAGFHLLMVPHTTPSTTLDLLIIMGSISFSGIYSGAPSKIHIIARHTVRNPAPARTGRERPRVVDGRRHIFEHQRQEGKEWRICHDKTLLTEKFFRQLFCAQECVLVTCTKNIYQLNLRARQISE